MYEEFGDFGLPLSHRCTVHLSLRYLNPLSHTLGSSDGTSETSADSQGSQSSVSIPSGGDGAQSGM